MSRNPVPVVPLPHFFMAAADASGFTVEDFTGLSRNSSVCGYRWEAAVLAWLEGYSFREIGEFLNRTEGGVRQQVNNYTRYAGSACGARIERFLLPPLVTTDEVAVPADEFTENFHDGDGWG